MLEVKLILSKGVDLSHLKMTRESTLLRAFCISRREAGDISVSTARSNKNNVLLSQHLICLISQLKANICSIVI